MASVTSATNDWNCCQVSSLVHDQLLVVVLKIAHRRQRVHAEHTIDVTGRASAVTLTDAPWLLALDSLAIDEADDVDNLYVVVHLVFGA